MIDKIKEWYDERVEAYYITIIIIIVLFVTYFILLLWWNSLRSVKEMMWMVELIRKQAEYRLYKYNDVLVGKYRSYIAVPEFAILWNGKPTKEMLETIKKHLEILEKKKWNRLVISDSNEKTI